MRGSARMTMLLTLLLFVGTAQADSPDGAAEPRTAASVYGQGVRSTSWQTPQQEQQGFHLPPGFEVRCFASEPQIAKPLNLAFSADGRVWLTQSTAYPYPAESGASTLDAVMILQDADQDGQAESVTEFAGGLNIPMGLLPYGDGCICFSIPDLIYLRDLDGDGVCDHRERLFGPFDTSRDTHGMVNSLRDGGDGWIYACHGFSNVSQLAGTDGHRVRLQSGNTFRFRPDGSRIEQFTHGQVNPFGMTVDDWGYRYSADCHSKPITQLIRGACYPSFGRPHDGLGFLPPTVDHLHGSTAIAGIAYISSRSQWKRLRGQMLSGNVMTSRINRNRISYSGATAKGQPMTDFLTSDDPWFRPVDLQFGPGGELYVADFYNRIIGHYEVPLDHPGRDRKSGRVWQIRFVGDAGDEDIGDDRAPELARLARLNWSSANPSTLTDPDHRQQLRQALDDSNAHVVRAAAEALGQVGEAADIALLVARLAQTSPDDPVLRQSLRIAIRDRVVANQDSAELWSHQLAWLDDPNAEPWADEFASILLAVKSPHAGDWILDHLTHHPQAPDRLELMRHAVRECVPNRLERCVQLAQSLAGNSIDQQVRWVTAVNKSAATAAGEPTAAIRDWARAIGRVCLREVDPVTARGIVAGTVDADIDANASTNPLKQATELIITFGLEDLEPDLERLVRTGNLPSADRLRAVASLKRVRTTPLQRLIVNSAIQFSLPAEIQSAVASAALDADQAETPSIVSQVLSHLSLQQQLEFVRLWASEGADLDQLIQLIDSGAVAAHALKPADVFDILAQRATAKQRHTLARLRELAPATEQHTATELAQLTKQIQASQSDRLRGQTLFKQHCEVCHQLRDSGTVVGPQLDGAATRSLSRLLEDILTPNRNVDPAFRSTTLLLENGRAVSGLIQLDAPTQVRIADVSGKPIELQTASITQRITSNCSLMPTNFGELLDVQALTDLIGYLTTPAPRGEIGSTAAAHADWIRHTIDDSLVGADGVRLGDFNADGLLDVVTGWEEAGVVRLYLNPGPGLASRNWPAVTVTEAGSPEDAVPFDLDGDGRLDIVSCHEGRTRELRVAWNNCRAVSRDQELLAKTSWQADRFPQLDNSQWMFALPLGSLGGDRRLVVGSKGDGASITLLRPGVGQPRELSSWRATRLRDAGWIMSLRAIDMDGDGDLDVVYSDRKGGQRGVGWLEQPDDLDQSWPDHLVGGADCEVMFLAPTAQQWRVATRNAVWLDFTVHDGSWSKHGRPNPAGVPLGKAIESLPDGRVVMTANTLGEKSDAKPGLWLGTIDGTWSVIDSTTKVKFDRIELLDLDGDGDLDVLTCEERRRLGVVWYENPGDHVVDRRNL